MVHYKPAVGNTGVYWEAIAFFRTTPDKVKTMQDFVARETAVHMGNNWKKEKITELWTKKINKDEDILALLGRCTDMTNFQEESKPTEYDANVQATDYSTGLTLDADEVEEEKSKAVEEEEKRWKNEERERMEEERKSKEKHKKKEPPELIEEKAFITENPDMQGLDNLEEDFKPDEDEEQPDKAQIIINVNSFKRFGKEKDREKIEKDKESDENAEADTDDVADVIQPKIG